MTAPTPHPPQSSTPLDSSILYEERGAVAVLTLNRPQALNSFTRAMHTALQQALAQASANAAIRALVITGAGRGFCAGLDLSELDFTPATACWSAPAPAR
jgi:2-(1,2-epoxy-1,2-dihydrophenyl)acetyl-CoA isomerase